LQQTVEKYVFGGYSEGYGIKQMRRAGDSAAVVLTKVLSGRVLDPEQTGSAVEVVEAAFSEPSLIELQSDRKPSTALFVLRSLDLSTHDLMLKARIGELRKLLIKLAAEQSGNLGR
jgi:hypothetical protein